MLDMTWFLGMMKRGYNPEQIMMNVLQEQMGGTPMGDNLIKLAQEGNVQEIEKIARNMSQQKGIDFDKEFNAFKMRLGF